MSNLPLIAGSPGVYRIENNNSGQAVAQVTTRCAIVAATRQGATANVFRSGVTTQTSPTSFTNEYGPSDLTWSYGQLTALAYLNTGRNLSFLRVVHEDALYSNAIVTGTATGAFGAGTILTQTPGTQLGYDGGEIQASAFGLNGGINGTCVLTNAGITLTGSLTLQQSISFSAVEMGKTNFISSLYTVCSQAMTSINNSAANNGITGFGSVNLYNNGLAIYITAPEGCLLTLNPGTLSVTGSGSNGGGTLRIQDPTMFNVFADNQGDWSEDYGFNITNINQGTNQIVELNFSEPFVTSNHITINLLMGGTLVSASTNYTVNSDTTMQNLAAAIVTAAISSVGLTPTAVATNANNSNSGFTEIMITSPVPGPNYITVPTLGASLYNISGGTSQPVVTFEQTLNGVASNNTFNFNVYNTSNLTTPLETFLVSLYQQTDNFGNQQFIEEVINNPYSGSQYMRIVVDPSYINNPIPMDTTSISNYASITFLSGGFDGSAVNDADIITGWQVFTAAEAFPIDLLVNAGYTGTDVRQEIANVAATREDCFAILDTPLNAISTNASGAGEINDRLYIMNINTTYAAAYTPWVQVTDLATDQLVYVPPSGYIADRFVYSDINYGFYQAPAGLKRGVLPVEGLYVIYEKPIRDLLDAVQLNALRLPLDGSGIVIWGDNTLTTVPSLLSAVNVRRCITIIENSIAAGLESEVFDLDNPSTWVIITQIANSVCQPVLDAGGINNFIVVCNDTNNTGEYEDAGQINLSVYIVPVRAGKIILLDTEIESNSVSFTEVVINGSL